MHTECVGTGTPKPDPNLLPQPSPVGGSDGQALSIRSVRFRLADLRSLAGWELNHPYVETFWLPVIDPTSTLLLRFVGRQARSTDWVRFDHPSLAMSLGLGTGRFGRNSPAIKTTRRLKVFGLATIDSSPEDPEMAVTVLPKVPTVRESLRRKWPDELHALHARVSALAPTCTTEVAS